MFRSKLSPVKFIELLPAIGALVGQIVSALKDGKISAEEVSDIGGKLVSLVASVLAE